MSSRELITRRDRELIQNFRHIRSMMDQHEVDRSAAVHFFQHHAGLLKERLSPVVAMQDGYNTKCDHILERAAWVVSVAETYCERIMGDQPSVETIVEWHMVLCNFKRTFAGMCCADRTSEEDCMVCSRNISVSDSSSVARRTRGATTRHDAWCDIVYPFFRRVETAFKKVCDIRKRADQLQGRMEVGFEEYDANITAYADIVEMRDYQHVKNSSIIEYPIPSLVTRKLRQNINYENFAKASRCVSADDVRDGLSCALCQDEFALAERATTSECTSWVMHGTSPFSFFPGNVITFLQPVIRRKMCLASRHLRTRASVFI